MPKEKPDTSEIKRERRWLRFSLAQLIIAVTLFCIVLGDMAILSAPVQSMEKTLSTGKVCRARIYRKLGFDDRWPFVVLKYTVTLHLDDMEIERFVADSDELYPGTFELGRETDDGSLWYGYSGGRHSISSTIETR